MGMKWLVLVALAACSTDTFVGPDGSVGDSGPDDVRSNEGGSVDASPCNPTPLTCTPNQVCNTFDQSQPTLAPFGDASQNGGAVTFTSDQFMTCPHAVAAMAPQTTGQARGAFGASAAITGVAVTHARVELDVLLPKNVTGSTAFVFLYANSDTSHGVGLVNQGGNWFVLDTTSGQNQGIDPRVGAWNHVALDVTFSESSNLGKVELDYIDSSGKPQIESFGSQTLVGTTIQSVAFIAGVVPYGTTTAPTTAYFDDVVWSPF
jgi:hypothetical protein